MRKNISTLSLLSKPLCGLVPIALLAAASMTARVAEADSLRLGLLYDDEIQFPFGRVYTNLSTDDRFYTPSSGLVLTYESQMPGGGWIQEYGFAFEYARRSQTGLYYTSDNNRKEFLVVPNSGLTDQDISETRSSVTEVSASRFDTSLFYAISYSTEVYSQNAVAVSLEPKFGVMWVRVSETYELKNYDTLDFNRNFIGTFADLVVEASLELEGGNRLTIESTCCTDFITDIQGLAITRYEHNFTSKSNKFTYSRGNSAAVNPREVISNLLKRQVRGITYEMSNGMSVFLGNDVITGISSDFSVAVGFEF